ncbi:putative GTP diphosphokinase RSH1, chloroplastic [Zea mays]|uniref:putative GTP diphosphokinase RSH1, chloroplastic n=1 Tax=Zea mays TaxID=4577 RepID=UPI0009A9B4ED|nr:putative GTP diphosphokinase RSH1, chloroplastic [Zea mays]|eukprot:XP_020401947.1 putative GTP diphosphokinase RSH1, chloroplastic [Zea mays]
MIQYYFLMFEILRFQANRILRQKIAEDQFLDHVSVETEVRSVYKELYSIYKTTLKSKSSINEVNQVAQLRIIIKSKSCNGVGPLCTAQQICYHVLGLVHGIWTPVPQAVKDYIATPKPNGYQSLHTTAIPFLNESMFHLEVQWKRSGFWTCSAWNIKWKKCQGESNLLEQHRLCSEDWLAQCNLRVARRVCW